MRLEKENRQHSKGSTIRMLNVRFVPKEDCRVYSSPVESNEFDGTFVGILKIEKI